MPKPRKQYEICGKDSHSRAVTASDMAWALGVEGYESTTAVRESAAGSFANTVYLITNAPIDRIRYYAAQGGVTVRKT
jgi:hypothetical protein